MISLSVALGRLHLGSQQDSEYLEAEALSDYNVVMPLPPRPVPVATELLPQDNRQKLGALAQFKNPIQKPHDSALVEVAVGLLELSLIYSRCLFSGCVKRHHTPALRTSRCFIGWVGSGARYQKVAVSSPAACP